MEDETTPGSEGSGASVRRRSRENTIASIASVRQEEKGQEGSTMERFMRLELRLHVLLHPSVERTSADTNRATHGRKIPSPHPIPDRDAPRLRSTTDVDPYLPWLRPLRSKIPSHLRLRSLPDCDPTKIFRGALLRMPGWDPGAMWGSDVLTSRIPASHVMRPFDPTLACGGDGANRLAPPRARLVPKAGRWIVQRM